jgi:poly-gamma-glutamate synthesis protein (capsule biosynthesis protein)
MNSLGRYVWRMRRVAVIAIASALALTAAPSAAGGGGTQGKPEFIGKISRISDARRDRMTGRSWHQGCPVAIGELRLVRVRHWDFDGEIERGRVIVHEDSADDILEVMKDLFRDRFPIRRMEVIDAYGGDDHRSMNADNTSAFNCRFVAGTQRWSEHAFGRALDLNPVENPYVTSGGHVSPPAGREFANRGRDAKGMVHGGDSTVRAFRRVGWGWGGSWSGTKDYQHFSATGG